MTTSVDVEGWLSLHPADYWVFDKLILARKLGHVCGPAGMPVPSPGQYVVRPIMNMHGMGILSRIEEITDQTSHLHPGEFWCEKFEGDHISVDYINQKPVLTVKGERNPENPVYKWDKWTKTDHCIGYPDILRDLHRHYEKVNCEFIGGKLIEVHFRHNPDFRFGNTEAIPVWDASQTERDGYTFVPDPDYKRIGFFIR
jgi:hypothetical protein